MKMMLILAGVVASMTTAQAGKMQVNPYPKGTSEAYAWCLITVARQKWSEAIATAQCSRLKTGNAHDDNETRQYAWAKALVSKEPTKGQAKLRKAFLSEPSPFCPTVRALVQGSKCPTLNVNTQVMVDCNVWNRSFTKIVYRGKEGFIVGEDTAMSARCPTR